MRVERLSREALERWMGDAVRLDALTIERLGRAFSDEAWGEENFRRDVPGKWELSRFALLDNRFAGYWIASAPSAGACHTHRVAVDPECIGRGVGRAMFESVWEDAGAATMTLEVGYANAGALAFYERLGFRRLGREGIFEYLIARGRQAFVFDDYHEEANGSRFRVLLYQRI
jgi:ribosomal protein S18 acetylase RimI-like enzyme